MMQINERQCLGTHFKGRHLSLSDLKKEPIDNKYLFKRNIPAYPESVVFHVQKVSHVTGKFGVHGIFADSGFRQPSDLVDNDKPHFLWWNLSLTSDDKSSAEEHFLKSLSNNQNPSQMCKDSPILQYFADSEAFKETSSYGNFRFTFSLKELLWHYGAQFCGGHSPVLRVYETVLFKKEIQYTVVVHPPNVDLYNDYPHLPSCGNGVCGYYGGFIWWCCQSPSEAYKYELEVNNSEGSVSVSPHNEVYYVWDHVSVAFHMEPGWVLHVDQNRLLNRLTACEVTECPLLRAPEYPLSLHEAERIVADLRASKGRGLEAGGWN